MTRKELRASVRSRLDDLVGSASEKFWPDSELNDYLEEAAEELAIECQLINDSLTDAICSITMVANQQHYPISSKIIRIEEVRGSWSTMPLTNAKSFRQLPTNWQSRKGQPRSYCLDFSSGYLTLDSSFEVVAGESVSLTVKRMPLLAMTDATGPEFDEQYHRKLISFVLYRAFSKPDAESKDEQKANKFQNEWDDAISQVKTREAKLRPRVMVTRRVEI